MSIAYGSIRAGADDIPRHLLNAEDNEFVEVIEITGAASPTLPGAVREWDFQARALTRLEKPFFCLAIAPDETQGRYTTDMLFDFIRRAEERNDMTGQPRAVIRHIKNGEEHFHVVWSRVDREKGVAKELRFFKERLMTVTREFARDHGLVLPDGYRRREDREWRKDRQLTPYDGIKQKATGVAHEDRMAAVTRAWQASDTAAAFVNALSERGYILSVGRNGSRLVLVDVYGHATALTRLIDDKQVRARQVRAFLGDDYAPDKLPAVEDAQAQARQHRQAIEDFETARQQSEQVADLRQRQQGRRHKLAAAIKSIRAAQALETGRQNHWHRTEREDLAAAQAAQSRRILEDRARHRATGLAAFLGRITGIALITKKLHERRDRQRADQHRDQMKKLAARQGVDDLALRRAQSLKRADLERQQRALPSVEKKELDALLTAQRAEYRTEYAKRYEHLPTFTLDLKPPGRPAAVDKAARRHLSDLDKPDDEPKGPDKPGRPIDLTDSFTDAAEPEDGDDGDGGDDDGGDRPGPPHKPKPPPTRRRRRRRDRDRDQGPGM